MTQDAKRHAATFLEQDFNQCSSLLRHYDSQIWDICKFAFTAYTFLLGAAIGLYKLGLENRLDLQWVAALVLGVGSLVGLFMLALTLRNRVYFTIVARYLNEHRHHFLSQKPLGFNNSTGMYTDPRRPPFYDPLSTQMWLFYLLALLNGVLLAALVYIIAGEATPAFHWAPVLALSAACAQIVLGVIYLHSREGRPAMDAVAPPPREPHRSDSTDRNS